MIPFARRDSCRQGGQVTLLGSVDELEGEGNHVGVDQGHKVLHTDTASEYRIQNVVMAWHSA